MLDLLADAILENHELVLREIGDRLALAIDHTHIDRHERRHAPEDRRRLGLRRRLLIRRRGNYGRGRNEEDERCQRADHANRHCGHYARLAKSKAHMKDMKIMKDMKAALTWRPPAAARR